MGAGSFQGEQGVEHRLQVSPALPHIDHVVEGFQIDIGSIDERGELIERLRVDIACRDQNVVQPMPMGQAGNLEHILDIGERLGIGIGNAGQAAFKSHADHSLGAHITAMHLARGCL